MAKHKNCRKSQVDSPVRKVTSPLSRTASAAAAGKDGEWRKKKTHFMSSHFCTNEWGKWMHQQQQKHTQRWKDKENENPDNGIWQCWARRRKDGEGERAEDSGSIPPSENSINSSSSSITKWQKQALLLPLEDDDDSAEKMEGKKEKERTKAKWHRVCRAECVWVVFAC